MKKYILSSLLTTGVIMFSGCAGASGPQFSKFEPPKSEKKGKVYFYRPSSFTGSMVGFDIHNASDNDKVIGKLVNGGYFEEELDTGKYEFWAETESKSQVSLDLKNGEIACVKATMGMGILLARPYLESVSRNICDAELKTTNKVE